MLTRIQLIYIIELTYNNKCRIVYLKNHLVILIQTHTFFLF